MAAGDTYYAVWLELSKFGTSHHCAILEEHPFEMVAFRRETSPMTLITVLWWTEISLAEVELARAAGVPE
jgi:hypothetical protein